MNDDRYKDKTRPTRPEETGLGRTTSDRRTSPEEIQALLAEPGYSADQRKSWLKEALTGLLNEPNPTPEQAELIREIKRVISSNQDRPLSDDTM